MFLGIKARAVDNNDVGSIPTRGSFGVTNVISKRIADDVYYYTASIGTVTLGFSPMFYLNYLNFYLRFRSLVENSMKGWIVLMGFHKFK